MASIHPDVPNFSWSELTPNHCTEKELVAHCCLAVGDRFWTHMKHLQAVRTQWGGPLTLTSTWRPEEYNKSVGGAPNSQHLVWATDVVPSNSTPERVKALAKIAEEFNFDGIGVYPDRGFVHLDMRGYVARWDG